jgi:hypothetical protein
MRLSPDARAAILTALRLFETMNSCNEKRLTRRLVRRLERFERVSEANVRSGRKNELASKSRRMEDHLKLYSRTHV